MEAIRVARAVTGRSGVVKVEGAYHGHHDLVMISVAPELSDLRRAPQDAESSAASLARVPFSTGIPPEVHQQVLVVPFNDAAALERGLAEHAEDFAAFSI